VGGGIAGLATAAFLVDDAHVPAANVTIYEALEVVGGSIDATGDSCHGHRNRGSRMFERYYECLYYPCGKIPSMQTAALSRSSSGR
jgi:oleate hydratase